MQFTTLAAIGICGLPLVAGQSACSTMPPDQQVKVTQALAVACNVDGAVVPVAQPVVATLGRAAQPSPARTACSSIRPSWPPASGSAARRRV